MLLSLTRNRLLKTIIGSALMALVHLLPEDASLKWIKTAQFSAKAWVALIFIAVGTWLASYGLRRDRSGKSQMCNERSMEKDY